ncbi:MAG: hypothetical protein H6622_17460 [Halobacteriovoraceae bacterium]|nr:hypothetical protein [Halobacteriovoraceae bacterium]
MNKIYLLALTLVILLQNAFASGSIESKILKKWDEFFELENETIIKLIKNNTRKSVVEYLNLTCDSENKVSRVESQLKHYPIDPLTNYSFSDPYSYTPFIDYSYLFSYYKMSTKEGPLCDFVIDKNGDLQADEVTCEREALNTTYLLDMCCRKSDCPEELNANFDQSETTEI